MGASSGGTKTARLVVTLALISGISRPAAGASGWITLSPHGEGFRCRFPGKPELHQRDVPTDIGTVHQREYYLDYSKHSPEGATFMVGFQDFPVLPGKKPEPTELIDGMTEGMQRGLKGRIQSQRSLSSGKWSGREVVFSSPAGKVLVAHFFVVRLRVYMSTVARRTDPRSTADCKQFLSSFKITQ